MKQRNKNTAARDNFVNEKKTTKAGSAVGAGLGAGVGAAAGTAAATGAAAGSVAGIPGSVVGGVAGAAIGGVAGALAGDYAEQKINPQEEDKYWQENYHDRDYIRAGESYDIYQPAYRYGVDAYITNKGRSYNEIEPQLEAGWERARGTSNLSWDRARLAVRDAYQRLFDRNKTPNE
jgi:hypothetical protein